MSESTKHDVIYLQVCDDDEDPWCGEVTWCQDRIHAEDVKYIRADLVKTRIAEAVEAECAACQAVATLVSEMVDHNGTQWERGWFEAATRIAEDIGDRK